MNDQQLDALREHLGREPSPMERVTWARRLRHEGDRTRRKAEPCTLEDRLREYVSNQRNHGRDDARIRRALERDKSNWLVPGEVNRGLPLSEEEIEAIYDTVIGELEG